MSTPSLIARLAGLQRAIILAVVLLFAGSALGWTAREFEQQDELELRHAAAHIVGSLGREWQDEPALTPAAVAAAALEEEGDAGVAFEVRDAQGATLAATIVPDSLRSARRSVTVQAGRGLQVVAAKSTSASHEALKAMTITFALVGVPIVLAGFLVSRALARRALRPLSRMTAAADEASRTGGVLTLAHASDPAELAPLGAAFDRLIARLDARAESERRFADDAAHELRTPLTGLSGELELTLEDTNLSERASAGLRRAGAQARALRELVDALLLLRSTEQGVLDPAHMREAVNLADLTREAVDDLLRQHSARGTDLRLECPDEVLVRGQAILLAAAIRNLMVNALQFTTLGQPIHVSVTHDGADAVVRVEDGGLGVAAADRERVFDPFFRSPAARASHEGSGLGLPILRRVARAHRGDVRLSESTLGGAAFELRLPGWAVGE